MTKFLVVMEIKVVTCIEIEAEDQLDAGHKIHSAFLSGDLDLIEHAAKEEMTDIPSIEMEIAPSDGSPDLDNIASLDAINEWESQNVVTISHDESAELMKQFIHSLSEEDVNRLQHNRRIQ